MLRSINVLSSKEKEYSIGVNFENQCENLAFSEQKLVSINSFYSEKKKKKFWFASMIYQIYELNDWA